MADPITRALELGPFIRYLYIKYNVGNLREIPAQTLLEESRELHDLVYGGRAYRP